jgi:hypothetical protein
MDQEDGPEPHPLEDDDKGEGPVFDAPPGLPPIGGFGGIASDEPDFIGGPSPDHHLSEVEDPNDISPLA